MRIQWLGELATALEEADLALAQLAKAGALPLDADCLRLRVFELRSELKRLNRVQLAKDRIIGSAWPDQARAP